MNELLDALASADATVVIDAPGVGPGYWAGGPSALVDEDGMHWLAYRLRRPVDQGRGYANVVARSEDGVHFETVATVTSEQFGSASLERPALARTPEGWRLYVSCSTWGSKHWWVEALDAPTVAELPTGKRTVILSGDVATAWKDPVVRTDANGWHMWVCRHPLDGGDDAADRMSTWYASSADGLDWAFTGPALTPAPGEWDQRGARVADVVLSDGKWWALYDGRASAAENWYERSGLAVGADPGDLAAVSGPVPAEPGRALRYATVVELAEGYRVYFEVTNDGGAHDLRTVYVPRPVSDIQSE